MSTKILSCNICLLPWLASVYCNNNASIIIITSYGGTKRIYTVCENCYKDLEDYSWVSRINLPVNDIKNIKNIVDVLDE